MAKPRLVVISDTIRRDLHKPLAYFEQIEIIHLYRSAAYGDMKPVDFEKPKAIQFKGIAHLYRAIKAIKPTMIQSAEPSANTTSFLVSLIVFIYWITYRPKIIVPFFENRPLEYKFNRIKYWLVVKMTQLICHISSLVIVLNKGARDNLERLGIKKSISLLWGSWGVDIEEFHPKKEKNNNEILYLGRITKAKGIEQLLSAYKIVKRDFPDATLKLAGPAGDAFELIENSDSNYIGSIKNSEVPDLLGSAGVVVMPSQTTKAWEEQVGMVGLQALACGTCVVTTKSGAIPEYFKQGQGAQLVEEKDIEGLANAIIRILKDSVYRTKQENMARQYVIQNFEVKSKIKEIETILVGLCNPESINKE